MSKKIKDQLTLEDEKVLIDLISQLTKCALIWKKRGKHCPVRGWLVSTASEGLELLLDAENERDLN